MQIVPNHIAIGELIARKQLAALVCMSPENFTYVAGVHITTMENMRPRQGFAVIPASSNPLLVVCGIEKSLVEGFSWVKDLRFYIEFKHDPIIELATALEAAGLGDARLGMDMDYLPASSHQRLMQKLPGLGLVNTTEDVAAIRAIKTDEEVAFIEKITRSTHKAILDALADCRIGDREDKVATAMARSLIDAGANGILHNHLASGERTPLVHNLPGPDRIQPGEVLRLDVGGLFGAYCSDLARTYSTGNPTELQRNTYRKLAEAHAETISVMKPGMLAEDVYAACKSALESRGLPCTLPHIGHSFGIEGHEAPMLRPGDKTPLAPGMVLNVEPMTIDANGVFYHTEDSVLITADGNRLLTYGLAPKEIPVIGSRAEGLGN